MKIRAYITRVTTEMKAGFERTVLWRRGLMSLRTIASDFVREAKIGA